MCAGHTSRTEPSDQKRAAQKNRGFPVAPKRCFMPLVFRNVPLLLRCSSFAACLPACHWLMKRRCLVWRKGRVREQDEAWKWTIPAAATGGPKPTSFRRGMVTVSWFGLSNLETNTLKPKFEHFESGDSPEFVSQVSIYNFICSHTRSVLSINMSKHVC